MRVALSRGSHRKAPYNRGLASGLSAASTDDEQTRRGFRRAAKWCAVANSVRAWWVRGPIGSVAGGTGHVAEVRDRLDIATSNDNVMYVTFWYKQGGPCQRLQQCRGPDRAARYDALKFWTPPSKSFWRTATAAPPSTSSSSAPGRPRPPYIRFSAARTACSPRSWMNAPSASFPRSATPRAFTPTSVMRSLTSRSAIWRSRWLRMLSVFGG